MKDDSDVNSNNNPDSVNGNKSVLLSEQRPSAFKVVSNCGLRNTGVLSSPFWRILPSIVQSRENGYFFIENLQCHSE